MEYANFKFARPYMIMLNRLTHRAWQNPERITEKDVNDLRRLCSLTKCEASTWYQLERIKTEQQHELHRNAPKYSEISGSAVSTLLKLVRKHKMNYCDNELVEFYKQHLSNEDNVVRQVNTHRYNKCPETQLQLAQQVMKMASELACLFDHDDAFIYYLETDLTPNATAILKADPLRYQHIIEGLVRLDTLRERTSHRVVELKKRLDEERAKYSADTSAWWIGTDEEQADFIEHCNKQEWLCTDGNGIPYVPYVLTDKCHHRELLHEIVALSIEGKKVRPLRPGDIRQNRHRADNYISCKELAEALSQNFCCPFHTPQVSEARKHLTGKGKR